MVWPQEKNGEENESEQIGMKRLGRPRKRWIDHVKEIDCRARRDRAWRDFVRVLSGRFARG